MRGRRWRPQAAREGALRCLLLILAAAILLTPTPASAAIDDTLLVDQTPSGTPAGGSSWTPSVSADGRYVAFYTNGYNTLSAGVPGYGPAVYRRDMETGELELVTVSTNPGHLTAGFFPSMSDDGRYIAFMSPVDDLVPGDDNGTWDVFVRDMQAGTTELVSRASGANGALGDDGSFNPSISGNGRFVAFVSPATNFSDDDFPYTDVFVRDLDTNETELVSCQDGPACAGADGDSSFPDSTHAISNDGRYVAFSSNANLAGYSQPLGYVRDRVAGTTTLVTRASGLTGEASNGALGRVAISGDGTVVAFDSDATNLTADPPVTGVRQVFRRDLATLQTTVVSRADGPTGAVQNDGYQLSPIVMTDDGRRVLFSSPATNLMAAATDGKAEVYLRDTATGTTELISRHDGGFGIAADTTPTIAFYSADLTADGDYAIYGSDDPAVVRNLNAGNEHLFRRQLTGAPPPAELGESVQVDLEAGGVTVRIPESSVFEPLKRGTEIPTGSEIDATDGTVEMTSDPGEAGEQDRSIAWSDGQFEVGQGTAEGALTEATLNGPLLGCELGGATPATLANVGEPATPLLAGRKLWGHGGKGHKSQGGKSSATVRGTKWLVWDTCDGKTVTYVSEGRVEVHDDERDRTVFVDPGEIYVAPSPPDTTINSGPGTSTADRTPTISFGAAEPWDMYECRIDDGSYQPCSSPMTSSRLQPGSRTFSVRAADEAGSADVPADQVQFFVRGELPVDRSLAKPRIKRARATSAGKSQKMRLQVKFVDRDPDAQFICAVDSKPWDLCSSPLDIRVSRGRHTVKVATLGEEGNSRSNVARWSGG